MSKHCQRSLRLVDWTIEEVVSWAAAEDLPSDVTSCLRGHAITGEVLESLTEEDLVSMGIQKLGWRRDLLLRRQKLLKQQELSVCSTPKISAFPKVSECRQDLSAHSAIRQQCFATVQDSHTCKSHGASFIAPSKPPPAPRPSIGGVKVYKPVLAAPRASNAVTCVKRSSSEHSLFVRSGICSPAAPQIFQQAPRIVHARSEHRAIPSPRTEMPCQLQPQNSPQLLPRTLSRTVQSAKQMEDVNCAFSHVPVSFHGTESRTPLPQARSTSRSSSFAEPTLCNSIKHIVQL